MKNEVLVIVVGAILVILVFHFFLLPAINQDKGLQCQVVIQFNYSEPEINENIIINGIKNNLSSSDISNLYPYFFNRMRLLEINSIPPYMLVFSNDRDISTEMLLVKSALEKIDGVSEVLADHQCTSWQSRDEK